MPDKYLSFDKTYYLICETGFNSKRLSTVLNNKGYHTYSIKSGYEKVLDESLFNLYYYI